MGEEELGLIERKLNKKKVVGCILILILILVSIAIIIYNNIKNTNVNNDVVKEKENDNVIIVDLDEPKQEENNIIKEKKALPVLTEEGKQRCANIYELEEKTAYLTFDDGPSNTVTPHILEVLKEKGVPATFFVLGSRVELYPELVLQEYQEGHYVANHGYSHVYSSIYSSPENVLNEFNQTEDAIKNALNEPNYNSHLFRFPGGSKGGKYSQIKNEATSILEENDIVYADWNALTNDSVGKPSKEEMMNQLISTVGEKNNVVILMHDAGDKISTYELLPDIIDYLKEKGYTFKNFYNIIK